MSGPGRPATADLMAVRNARHERPATPRAAVLGNIDGPQRRASGPPGLLLRLRHRLVASEQEPDRARDRRYVSSYGAGWQGSGCTPSRRGLGRTARSPRVSCAKPWRLGCPRDSEPEPSVMSWSKSWSGRRVRPAPTAATRCGRPFPREMPIRHRVGQDKLAIVEFEQLFATCGHLG